MKLKFIQVFFLIKDPPDHMLDDESDVGPRDLAIRIDLSPKIDPGIMLGPLTEIRQKRYI